ncbi:MAG: transposase [Phycisphaerae bacterium]
MVAAYHSTFCTYGFWLPNDPRGSWSDYVRNWELYYAAGGGTACGARRSVAAVAHDRASRQRGKETLANPTVRFSMEQIAAIGRGFGVACAETNYRILACAIMPDHVHTVILRHAKQIEQVVGHLRSRGTKQLNAESLRTDPIVWAQKGWNVYLDTAEDIARAIEYVNNNPIKAGLAPQTWDFITPWGNGAV